MSNLPVGSKDRIDAPWNKNEENIKEVEVEIIVTYKRKVKIEVNKNYTQKDLEDKVKEQIWLPQEVVERFIKNKELLKETNWKVEELIIEEV